MSATLAFDDVACLRGGRMLFEGLSFALAPGEAALVTGPNGAGKSSLIRVAAGLLAPLVGRVAAEGRIALLTESAALDAEQPLAEALRFWAALDGIEGARRRTGDALHDCGLAALAAVPVRLLSTGQRRRAALARVVASQAPIWLLDEPGNGLDTAAIATLERLIARHREVGGIALVATHQPIALPRAQPIVIEASA